MKFWDFINWVFLGDIFILCLSALLIVATLATIIAIIYFTWEETFSPQNRDVKAKIAQLEKEFDQKFKTWCQLEREKMEEKMGLKYPKRREW